MTAHEIIHEVLFISTVDIKEKIAKSRKNQGVNNRFGGLLNLTSLRSDLTWVETHHA